MKSLIKKKKKKGSKKASNKPMFSNHNHEHLEDETYSRNNQSQTHQTAA